VHTHALICGGDFAERMIAHIDKGVVKLSLVQYLKHSLDILDTTERHSKGEKESIEMSEDRGWR
jgi:hypothetical protein